MKPIEILLKIFGIFICLVFSYLQQDFIWVQVSLFGLILLTIGIPHGAIDHLISNPILVRKTFILFLVKYLALLLSYLVIWFYFPVLALLAFLIMSAYHFGQTHYITCIGIFARPWMLYISRGGYFLAVILVGNWGYTSSILSSLTSLASIDPYKFWIIGLFFTSTILIQTVWGPQWSKSHLLEIFILGPILYFTPLLIGFIVYFGFWHSLPSMLKEYDFLSGFEAYNSPKKFTIQLMPFSIISLFGISIILFLGLKYLEMNELILLFFVLISLISFPHILYMDKFLRQEPKTDL